MALFSSTQPSLRARILPRFPAQVLAGNGMTITKSGGIYTFAVINPIGGSNGQVQFNDTDALGGDPAFTYDKLTDTLTVGALAVTGNMVAGGLTEAGSSLKTTPTTVALLPAPGVAGRRAFVTDATGATFGSVVVGGGINRVPVYDTEVAWRIG